MPNLHDQAIYYLYEDLPDLVLGASYDPRELLQYLRSIPGSDDLPNMWMIGRYEVHFGT